MNKINSITLRSYIKLVKFKTIFYRNYKIFNVATLQQELSLTNLVKKRKKGVD